MECHKKVLVTAQKTSFKIVPKTNWQNFPWTIHRGSSMTTGRFLVHVYNQWTWQRFLCDLFWRNMTTWEFRWCVYFNCNFECKPPKSQTFFSLLKEWPAMAAFLVGWPNPQDIDVEATRSHTQLHRCGDGRILHRYSRSRREWVSPGMVFFFKKQFPQLSGKIRPNDHHCLTIYFQVGSLSWGGERKGYPAILESAWNWPKGIWIRIFVGLRKLWSLNSPMCLETFLSFCVWNQKTQIPQPNIHPKSHEILFWLDRYEIQL